MTTALFLKTCLVPLKFDGTAVFEILNVEPMLRDNPSVL